MERPAGGKLETFADPSVPKGADGTYRAYATSDPLDDRDRDANGARRIRRIPFASSKDLVHWTYAGEALASAPARGGAGERLWAPDIREHDGRFLPYFTVTNSSDAVSGEPGCGFDRAVRRRGGPLARRPFTPTAAPVVAPRRGGAGCTSSGPSTPRSAPPRWLASPLPRQLLRRDRGAAALPRTA